jgi:hypothetical protein
LVLTPLMDSCRRTGAAIKAHERFLAWLAPTIEKFRKSHEFIEGDRTIGTALDVLEVLIEGILSP